MTIANGTWKARGCEALLGKASTGTDQVGVDLQILEGPSQGAHVTWYGYFSEAAFERTIESLRLLGWEGDDLSDLRGIDRLEVSIVVEDEADLQGEFRPRVKWINALGGIAMKDKMDIGTAKAFAQSMKGRVLALKQKTGSPASAPRAATQTRATDQRPTPAAESPADDNIPF